MTEFQKLNYEPVDAFPVGGFITFNSRNPGPMYVSRMDHIGYQFFRAYHVLCFFGLAAGTLAALSYAMR